MNIINLTGHDITILRDDNTVARIFPVQGNVRVNQVTIHAEGFDSVNYPISHTSFGTARLPEYKDGVYYIVSSIVRLVFPNRYDLLVPSEIVYEKTSRGKIVLGCRSLDCKI